MEKPDPMQVMQQLIDCKDEKRQEQLISVLSRCEPYHITKNDYFSLLIQTPLANLKRVYAKYGYFGIGHSISKIWSIALQSKIMELENKMPELTLEQVFQEKLKIAENRFDRFIFKYKGQMYYFEDMYLDGPVSITEL